MSTNEFIEEKVGQYFELLELLTEGLDWGQSGTELASVTGLQEVYDSFHPQLRSVANLYTDTRFQDIPAKNLADFLENIHSYTTTALTSYRTILNTFFAEVESQLYLVITKTDRLDKVQTLLAGLIAPKLDYGFSRFFYAQTLPKFTPFDEPSFDGFMTSVQKTDQAVTVLMKLFTSDVVGSLQRNEKPTIINQTFDELEKILPILPTPYDKKMRALLIDYITLVHEFQNVLVGAYQLSTLRGKWVDQGLFITHAFEDNCQQQISILEGLVDYVGKRLDQALHFGISKDFFGQLLEDRRKLRSSHKSLRESLEREATWVGDSPQQLGQLSLATVTMLEVVKTKYPPNLPKDLQAVLDNCVTTHLEFVEWWAEARPALEYQLQLPGLITEPLSLAWDPRLVDNVRLLAKTELQGFFQNTPSKNVWQFLNSFDKDFLPVVTHFQNSHKSVLNALADVRNWSVVRTLKVVEEGRGIIDAIQGFFARWGEGDLAFVVDQLHHTYKQDFVVLYGHFDKIFTAFERGQKLRFSQPDQAVAALDSGVEHIREVRPLLNQLFPSHPQYVDNINQTQLHFIVRKLTIKYLDTPVTELVDQLCLQWEEVTLHPLANEMARKVEAVNSQLTDELQQAIDRQLRVANALVKTCETIQGLENYWADSILDMLLDTQTGKSLFSQLEPLPKVLQGLPALLPPNRKDSAKTVVQRIQEVIQRLAPMWLSLQRRVSLFLQQQQTKGTLADRENQLSSLLEGAKLDLGTQLSFGFPPFELLLDRFRTDFFPTFKAYYVQWLRHENHWHKSITVMGDRQTQEKKWTTHRGKLEKELEALIGLDLELYLGNLGKRIRDNAEERLLVLRESLDSDAPVARMKGLCVATREVGFDLGMFGG